MLKKPIPAFDLFFAHPLTALALAFTLLPASRVLSEAPVPSEAPTLHASQLEVSLKLQRPTSSDPSKFSVVNRNEKWTPNETAIVVCDVWDYHHSPNAVARLQQLLPRLDAVLKSARGKGVTIIHAPSDCMDAYQEHPARRRAIAAPRTQRINQPTLVHGVPRFQQKKRPPIRLINQTVVKTMTGRCMPSGRKSWSKWDAIPTCPGNDKTLESPSTHKKTTSATVVTRSGIS